MGLAIGMALVNICFPAWLAAMAAAPDGYYNSLRAKSGSELLSAVGAIGNGHAVISYGSDTWNAFRQTDVREIGGNEIWWDMYSNNIVYVPEHDALNLEHSVANSWWGGKNGSREAYSDLFLLNPSDQNANNKKSNNPPGEVADARLFDNGLFSVGTPVTGQGGGASSVFEPADEYKGDFARAYFYVFSTYKNLDWETDYVCDSDGTLKPWAVELLLKWHRDDPVDTRELNRNEAVYGIQGNRNPFIDYPTLAEYVWGSQKGNAFYPEKEPATEPEDRPDAPLFAGAWMRGVNTWEMRWWDGVRIPVEYAGGRLYMSIDGRDEYENTTGTIDVDPASDASERHVYKAHVTSLEGLRLSSPVATLTLSAADPSLPDYSLANWTRVTHDTPDPADGLYLFLSANTLHVMSVNGGTSKESFMPSAGFVRFDDEGRITELPVDAAVVELSTAGGKRRILIRDIYGQFKGGWNATAEKKMRLDASTYTPGTAEINADDEFLFTFEGDVGKLRFNASQPRFLNYQKSAQTPVYLYRFDSFGGLSGIGEVAAEPAWAVGVENGHLILPEGARVFDLNGREVTGGDLRRGVYIVTGEGHSTKIIL